ncbi:hypothetical protein FA15DRAFT_747867 [Coprinopsis marcescibilis]|uniref:Uncharacterized protein n=1 Tax=Coprinopsis marcescibilis TaxID=230819 RepID=A0A5C3L7E8_COPMA|nr:hypothetical protein FA15DRAFT_747867 [Coprinopsis marcescibilis]
MDLTQPRTRMTRRELSALHDLDGERSSGMDGPPHERHSSHLGDFIALTSLWKSQGISKKELQGKMKSYFWPNQPGKTMMETRPNIFNFSDSAFATLVEDLIIGTTLYRKQPLSAADTSQLLWRELNINIKETDRIPWLFNSYMSISGFQMDAQFAREENMCSLNEWRGRHFRDAIHNWAAHWVVYLRLDARELKHKLNIVFGIDLDKPRTEWDEVEWFVYAEIKLPGW